MKSLLNMLIVVGLFVMGLMFCANLLTDNGAWVALLGSLPLLGMTANIGVSGVTATRTANYRNVLASANGLVLLPGGGVIDGSKSRDPLNTSYLDRLRCGMLLGQITASGKYAPSILGVTTAAYTSGGTSLTVGAATAVELNRRIGASGSAKLIAPPTAGGTVATLTVTYSAVNTTTGVITVSSLGADAIAGSFLVPADGSETPLCIFGSEEGLRVTDEDGTSIDVEAPRLIVGGHIDASQILNYPSDTSLVAWVKAALRAVGTGFTFDDDFTI